MITTEDSNKYSDIIELLERPNPTTGAPSHYVEFLPREVQVIEKKDSRIKDERVYSLTYEAFTELMVRYRDAKSADEMSGWSS